MARPEEIEEDVVGKPVPLTFSGDEDENVVELPEGLAVPEGVEVVEEEEKSGEEEEEKAEEEVKAPPESMAQDVLAKQFEALNQNLQKMSARGEPVPERKAGEGDAEFWQRIGTDMFDEDKMKGALTEAVQRITTPAMTKLAASQMEDKKTILSLDPKTKDVFDTYGDEIDAEVVKLVKQYGPDPNIPKVALEKVKASHQSEIEEKKVSAQVEELVAKKLEELGIVGGEGKPKAKEFTAAGVGATTGTRRTGKRVRITQQVRKEAMKRGLTPEQYLGVY